DTVAQRLFGLVQGQLRAARTPLELVLAFSAAAEAVGHAANAASQALAVLSGLANQHARYERRSGRGV
ncbi:MAG TPA: hypothetical protein VK447_07205, partial [Myxococcaceae bacterium]|nr:hypothetical protein [Myxococcaceae bacterium]